MAVLLCARLEHSPISRVGRGLLLSALLLLLLSAVCGLVPRLRCVASSPAWFFGAFRSVALDLILCDRCRFCAARVLRAPREVDFVFSATAAGFQPLHPETSPSRAQRGSCPPQDIDLFSPLLGVFFVRGHFWPGCSGQLRPLAFAVL